MNDYRIAFYLSPLLILSIAYFIPQIKLRKNFWFKLFTLVLVWVMVTAVVPMLLNREYFSTSPKAMYNAGLHIAARFCFMLAICIPFDIRDMQIDKKENVATLPNELGENKTRWIAVFAVIIYSFLLITEVAMQVVNLPVFFALIVNMSITLLLVLFSNSKRSEYYFTAGIDGTMIIQYLLILIVTYFTKII
jgi:4-hydroxybenzoate polyprenyltransferase